MYLENITCPKDIKGLTVEQLTILAEECREGLFNKLTYTGGHFGPNFGVVELTIAMHYVFDSPKDQFVFDVSHQCYVHKMLTGRQRAYLNPELYSKEISGYSNPDESEHDFFKIGHTSTSLSLACGLQKARDILGKEGNVVAVIGDGSLSGGEAYEGLNNIAELGTNAIVIVNDNEMSIAENYGGLYKNLRALRESGGACACNFFKALGFTYHYVEEGNDLATLITALQKVKDSPVPTVLHVHTLKGKGYTPAEEHKEPWHWCMPFDRATGKAKVQGGGEDYVSLTRDYLIKKIEEDPSVVAMTAGTPVVYGFTEDIRKKAGKQFVDVGIAEEHAVAMASAMAKGGAKPVFPVNATFLQRAYDQLSQDLCINQNSAVIPVFNGSVFGMTDITHVCLYDIAMLSNIPNLIYLAPTCKEEYIAMMDWAIDQNKYSVAIRVPGGKLRVAGKQDCTDYNQLNKFQMVTKGEKVAVFAVGTFYELGEQVVQALEKEGVKATLINPKFVSGLDSELMQALIVNHNLVVTLEDGILDGGFGQKVASFYGNTSVKVQNYGFEKIFPDRYQPLELMKQNGLTVEQIVEKIKKAL